MISLFESDMSEKPTPLLSIPFNPTLQTQVGGTATESLSYDAPVLLGVSLGNHARLGGVATTATGAALGVHRAPETPSPESETNTKFGGQNLGFLSRDPTTENRNGGIHTRQP